MKAFKDVKVKDYKGTDIDITREFRILWRGQGLDELVINVEDGCCSHKY